MKIIRFQQKRFFITIAFLCVTIIIIHFLWTDETGSQCVVSPDIHEKLNYILEQTQESLKTLNLSYFLCYNSLWGVLKHKGHLPWQSSLEMCVLNKEMSATDEGFLARAFKRHDLAINYNSAGGFYKVNKLGEGFPIASLTVFEDDPLTHQMRRVGWIHRMLPPNSCEELHCFPPSLIAPPLPMLMFGKHKVLVPREGIEIQKYLFPNSWWKEISPARCH